MLIRTSVMEARDGKLLAPAGVAGGRTPGQVPSQSTGSSIPVVFRVRAKSATDCGSLLADLHVNRGRFHEGDNIVLRGVTLAGFPFTHRGHHHRRKPAGPIEFFRIPKDRSVDEIALGDSKQSGEGLDRELLNSPECECVTMFVFSLVLSDRSLCHVFFP